MKLRDDPDAASSMAAVLTQSNSFKLTGKIGRRPTDAELYMAHFMGVGGAGKTDLERRGQSAGLCRADVSERRRGQPLDLLRSKRQRAQRLRSLLGAELALCRRRQFAGHAHRDGAVGGDIQNAVALASAVPAPALSIDNAAYLSSFPDSRGVTPVAASSQHDADRAHRSDLPLAVPGRRTDRSRSRRRCRNCGAMRLR